MKACQTGAAAAKYGGSVLISYRDCAVSAAAALAHGITWLKFDLLAKEKGRGWVKKQREGFLKTWYNASFQGIQNLMGIGEMIFFLRNIPVFQVKGNIHIRIQVCQTRIRTAIPPNLHKGPLGKQK